MSDTPEQPHRIDRLLDAMELVQAGKRKEALPILRELIRDDKDFEDAWLWLSVAVDSADQSAVCLDNVLRINPKNALALGALSRLRESELRSLNHRDKIRGYRDFAFTSLWLLGTGLIFASFITIMTYVNALSASGTT
jgi:hypothetical protein